MHKSQNMSQRRVTLQLTLANVDRSPEELVQEDGTPVDGRYHFRSTNKRSHGPFDPWELRNELLTWPLEDWNAFPFMSGHFGTLKLGKEDFEEWQHLLKRALLEPASNWAMFSTENDSKFNRRLDTQKIGKLQRAVSIAFDWTCDPPAANVVCGSVLDSVIATIQLDKLLGAEFRECARKDCTSPPFAATRKNKIFCSSDCAHLVAVRSSRSRDAARNADNNRKGKAPEEGTDVSL